MHTSILGTGSIEDERLILASEWLGNKLLGPRLSRNVGVEINLRHDLPKIRGVFGQTSKADASYRPREFDIDLYSRHGGEKLLQNLCHEMVHVKQLARLELQDNDTPARRHKIWKGQEYDDSKIDYWDLPWEIEAHGMERGLYIRLMDHFDLIGI